MAWKCQWFDFADPSSILSFQILNITLSRPGVAFRQGPVSIVFAIRDRYGFLNGSEVSEQLRNLSVVEFSFYLGFPVQQIAEREYLLFAKTAKYFF